MSTLPELPATVGTKHPRVMAAYRALGRACADAGPLDEKTIHFVKLAIAIGVASEGAVHSHTRRALEAGATRSELEQVALLAITTAGFPRAMAGLSWVRDIVERRGGVTARETRKRRSPRR